MSDPTRVDSFRATLAHALRLHDKIQTLSDSLAETLQVLESLGHDIPRAEVIEAAEALTDAAVPGRGGIRTLARRPEPAQPGELIRRQRGEQTLWPDFSLVPAVVYLLLLGREVQYVGYSTNVRDRMAGHAKKQWDNIEIITCASTAEAYQLEGDLIFQHQPPLNRADLNRRRSLQERPCPG